MGVVFDALQEALNRRVAVKRLPTGLGKQLTRSRAEAETLGQLRHPNIVQIYEILEHNTGLYLILELVDGGSLEKKLLGKPKPPQITAGFIETIARAVHYAHNKGIIHRDLKPANILLARKDELKSEDSEAPGSDSSFAFHLSSFIPKVADFGIAKRLSSDPGETREGDVLGTPSYMAPEQAGGKSDQIGPMTDVYSLGVVLYEMLTGRVPLQGPTTLDTLLMVRNEEPVPPRHLQPGIPRDLETICLKCLQKEPGRRYGTAEHLAADLRRFLDGKPILARRTPAWERAWKWARREPRIAGLSTALVLVIAVGFTLVTLQWRSERQAKKQAQENERKADQLSASIALDRGMTLADAGKLNQGLLWMARSLELAIQANDADLERAIRYNLAAWKTFLTSPGPEFPHRDWVWAVAFSPDGTKILTGSKDRTARLWDARTGQPIGEPMRHDQPVWALAFSRDGTKILTGSGDRKGGSARLWDTATAQPLLASISHTTSVESVEFSPDGQRFLTVCEDQARLWQTADASPIGQPLTHLAPEFLDPRADASMSAAFSPEGNLVASGGLDGRIRFWDPMTGKPRGSSMQASGPILSLAFSPDGQMLLTGSFDGTAQLWDVGTGLARGPALRHSGRVRVVAFSNDGDIIATAAMEEDIVPAPENFLVTGGEVRLWQTRTGRRLGPPLRHPHPVRSVAFSPDNRTLVTGSRDGLARFFLLATGAPMGDPLQLEGTVTAVAFRNDGRTVVAASAGGGQFAAARVWETPPGQGRGKPLLQSAELLQMLFTPDGHNILSTAIDGNVRLVNLSGEPIAPVHSHSKYPTALSLSPDGKTYLLGFQDGRLQSWDLLGTHERYEIRTHGWINVFAFSPDGRTYLVGDRGGFLWHRETETGRLIGEPFRTSSPYWSVTFTPDGQKFLVGTDDGAQLWDLGTREMLQKSPTRGQVTQILIRPDGTGALLVVGGFAREWNFGTDGAIHSPGFQPEGGISYLALSPDGKRVLISGSDRVARLWDVSTGKQLGPSLGTRVRPVAFTQDNHLMAAGDTDGRIVVWEPSGSIQGGPERIRIWIETLTRMELDRTGTIRGLSAEEVQERARRLQAAGGSP
jgi:WD40 repeat protein